MILILDIPVLPPGVIGIVVVILTLQFGTDVVPELIVHLHQPIQFGYQLNVCCHVSHLTNDFYRNILCNEYSNVVNPVAIHIHYPGFPIQYLPLTADIAMAIQFLNQKKSTTEKEDELITIPDRIDP